MKYIISRDIDGEYNSSPKANNDVNIIAIKYGFQPLVRMKEIQRLSIFKVCWYINVVVCLFLKVGPNDVIFCHDSNNVLDIVIKIKRLKKYAVITLIHDLYCVRYDDINSHRSKIDSELFLIKQCDFLIVHNDKMKGKLATMGLEASKMYSLEIFDYLLKRDYEIKSCDYSDRTIAFAANLKYASFLPEFERKSRGGYIRQCVWYSRT